MDLSRKPCIPWNIGDHLHQKMEAQNRQRKCQRERAEGEREESYGEATPRFSNLKHFEAGPKINIF